MASITVCMTTYNGADFLAEQLETIASQSLLPSELIACDDASTDRTTTLLGEFARSAPFKVHILENPRNIGWARTLRRAVSHAASDLVALADQDDRWVANKLESEASALQAHPHAEAVAADSLPFRGRAASPTNATVWRSVGTKRIPQAEILALAERNFIAAHSLVVRRQSLERYLWPDGVPCPDYWLALIFSARRTLLLLNEVLVHYRLHPHQSIGITRGRALTPNIAAWNSAATTLGEFLAFASQRGLHLEREVIAAIQDHSRFLRNRAAYAATPRQEWRRLIGLLGSPRAYWRFGHGYRSLLADLIALAMTESHNE